MAAQAMPEISDEELMMNNTLIIDAAHREEYLRELREVLPQARRLDACISLEVGEVVDRPGVFILSERWRNGNEYAKEILQLPFYQKYLQRSEPFYAAPRTVVALRAVR